MNGSAITRSVSRLWMLALGVVAIAVLYLAKVLFLPLAFAVLFAFLLAPLVGALERVRFPRTLAALVVILAFAALLACAGWIFFSQLVAIANDLPTYRDNIGQKMAAIHRPGNSAYSRAEREMEQLSDEVGLANSSPAHLHSEGTAQQKPLGASPEHPIQVKEVSKPPARLDQLGGIVEPLTTALLSVVFTFFVLLQREDLRNRLIRLSGDHSVSVITQAMRDASARISRYFSLQLLVNTIYGSIIFLALHIIGLPHALLFGTLAGMLRFIPYIGWIGAAALPTVLSLAVFHGWQKTLVIVGIFLCMEIVTGNYAEPHIYGKHTGLSSLAILVAAAFWTLIWGPVGLVLSVPLTVCLVVLGRHVPALEFFTVMLGDEPAIAPWTGFYQRLLAHDVREAGQVLESCLEHHPLEHVYDSVLIPALVVCEEDRQRSEVDEPTVRFIRRRSREFIEELGFRDNREVEAGRFAPMTPPAANGQPLHVVCIPVREETDELAALMLAQVLESAEVRTMIHPVRRLEDIAAESPVEEADLVFLSALPPVGLARCHRLYQGIRSRQPELRIMIGIWNYPDGPEDAARRISNGEEARIWTQLSEAIREVRTMAAGTGDAAPPVGSLPGASAA